MRFCSASGGRGKTEFATLSLFRFFTTAPDTFPQNWEYAYPEESGLRRFSDTGCQASVWVLCSCFSGTVCQPVFHRTHIAQIRMHTFSVVEQFDILKYFCLDFVYCSIVFQVNAFFLCCCKETFRAGIVIRASGPAHALPDTIFPQHPLIALTVVLGAYYFEQEKRAIWLSKTQIALC